MAAAREKSIETKVCDNAILSINIKMLSEEIKGTGNLRRFVVNQLPGNATGWLQREIFDNLWESSL